MRLSLDPVDGELPNMDSVGKLRRPKATSFCLRLLSLLPLTKASSAYGSSGEWKTLKVTTGTTLFAGLKSRLS